MTITFTVPGPPRGQGRPRACVRGKHAGVYKAKADGVYENLIKLRCIEAWQGRPPLEGPVMLTVEAVYVVPGSWSRKKREAARHKTSKPDLDNVVKAAKDGIRHVAYHDDNQVVRIAAVKRYGERDELVVGVAAMEDAP